jgi:indolepyruvate ferredoxin oxidoreductase beta subunit
MVIALEPIEALRVLGHYGSPITKVLCNTRPIHPVAVISGEVSYPTADELQNWVRELTQESWFVNATDAAMKMGGAIYGNIMLIGALAGIGELPLDRQDFKKVISRSMPADKVEDNLCAYDMGVDMIRNA